MFATIPVGKLPVHRIRKQRCGDEEDDCCRHRNRLEKDCPWEGNNPADLWGADDTEVNGNAKVFQGRDKSYA